MNGPLLTDFLLRSPCLTLQNNTNIFFVRSASAIDEIQVEFEGETYPLREIADISKADPKRIIIDSSAIPQATKIIIQALQSKKTMNLNPQQEGTRIYVPVPKVTKGQLNSE